MEIDLVYLWVNGDDPVWQQKHNAYTGNTDTTTSTNCKGRYANNDELKYSLRSMDTYAPWIRRIFIVTDNQVPAWLNTQNPKIRIVDHKDIMPETCLPCFNSTLIEHFLYKIPELSEHFLYANDDVFINKPVTPETFFGTDGLPIMRMNRVFPRRLEIWFRTKVLRNMPGNYTMITHNAAKLVQEKYGKYYDARTHHNIDAYLKSSYRHVYEMFQTDIEATLGNHLRSANDIHRHLYTYVALIEKQAHLQYVTQKTSFRFDIHKWKHYRRMERYSPLFFCMNDSERVNDNDRAKSEAFLAARFPNKSQYEK